MHVVKWTWMEDTKFPKLYCGPRFVMSVFPLPALFSSCVFTMIKLISTRLNFSAETYCQTVKTCYISCFQSTTNNPSIPTFVLLESISQSDDILQNRNISTQSFLSVCQSNKLYVNVQAACKIFKCSGIFIEVLSLVEADLFWRWTLHMSPHRLELSLYMLVKPFSKCNANTITH